MKFTTHLGECRAQSLNPEVVLEWFQMLESVVHEYEVTPENIFNMDEKGFQLGGADKIKAISDRDLNTLYKVAKSSKELVTVIEAISATGRWLIPCVIFKGKRRNLAWTENNPCGARFGLFHTSGCMN